MITNQCSHNHNQCHLSFPHQIDVFDFKKKFLVVVSFQVKNSQWTHIIAALLDICFFLENSTSSETFSLH